MISREQIIERRDALNAQCAEIRVAVDETQKRGAALIEQLNAAMGAAQDCDYWLTQLGEPQKGDV